MTAIDDVREAHKEDGLARHIDIMEAILELDARMKELEDNILWLNRATNYCGCTDKLCKAEQRESQTQAWLDKRKLPFDTGPVLNDAKPTPTDEELVEKLITEYLFLFNARFDMDVKDSEDVRDILRQLIKDVKR